MFTDIGKTADEVAATLRACGIKGMPNTVLAFNPIVKYAVTQITADALIVDVTKGNALTITYRDWRSEAVPLPPPVMDFLDRFNRGEYPDLIAKPRGAN